MERVRKEFFQSNNGVDKIHFICWEPSGIKVKAVVQIAHGMVEHIERYEEFAKFLNNQGIVVVGNDHLGHGNSVRDNSKYGFFSNKNGDEYLIEDMRSLFIRTKEKYSNVPYILFGHSMGSFLTRKYISKYSDDLDGVVICGTGNKSRATISIGQKVVRFLMKLKGQGYRSKLVDNLAFGGYNKKFEPARTSKDWLSSDPKIVDEYLQDKKCNFIFTLSAYNDLFSVIDFVSKVHNIESIRKSIPVLFIAGNMDPVGNFGEGVKEVYNKFKAAGIRDVSLKLYDGKRHEILNEVDKEVVYKDVVLWIERIIN